MTTQTKAEMIKDFSASENEASAALELFRVLRPAITVKRSNGRIETTSGDKNILGLYRTIKDIIRKEERDDEKILKKDDFERIASDANGNPRYVIHFLKCCPESWKNDGICRYENVCKLTNKIGGRKYHNKQYGGGIAFQSYSLKEAIANINRMIASIDK